MLINFPLYCPKFKQESLISVKDLQITVIKEPDTKDADQMNLWDTYRSSDLSLFIKQVGQSHQIKNGAFGGLCCHAKINFCHSKPV